VSQFCLRRWTTHIALTFLVLASSTGAGWAQASPYPAPDQQAIYQRLLGEINKIAIFDNHSHPGYPDDEDTDAMASPPGEPAFRLRPDNPELVNASKALFGYPYDDFSPEHQKWLIQRKTEMKKKQGPLYFDHILDQLNIQTAVANRVSMPTYLDRKRFLWAFFVDSLLFPFDNREYAARNGDLAVYVPLQTRKLQRELKQEGLNQLPQDLDHYLAFISQLIEHNKREGGVSMKFEIAYFRSLRFGDPPQQQAAAIYGKYRGGGAPKSEEYEVFQDFVFRYLLREAARLSLPIQFHSAVGIGDFFSLTDGNVLNLENVLRDPRYEKVTFILVHGGYPFDRQAIWLTARKNVYLDSSLTDLYLYPSQFKSVLKDWLTKFPEKVMFGSDAFPFSEALGAEESYWLSTNSSRAALAAALSELVSEKAISEQKALQIAHMYLFENAAKLYPVQR
jgi:uncharacterized protein